MAAPVKVAVFGATGRTGKSIVDGLVSSSETKFEVHALIRPSSLEKPDVKALVERGIHVVAFELSAKKDELVKTLKGIDVLISTISYSTLDDQALLVDAVKEAGVKRFVPSHWATPAPRGVMRMRDQKLDVLAAFQRAYIPYTVIEVGWWMQGAIPKVPSGRTNDAVWDMFNFIPGDGNVPSAFVDLRDIGKYVAKIIVDPRTLNRSVLAYTEVLTYNQVADLMDEVSGEKSERNYLSAKAIHEKLSAASEALEKDPSDQSAVFTLIGYQYVDSWGLRGDNTPESAKYLCFLDVKELYPGTTGRTMRSLFQDTLEGKPTGFKAFKGIPPK